MGEWDKLWNVPLFLSCSVSASASASFLFSIYFPFDSGLLLPRPQPNRSVLNLKDLVHVNHYSTQAPLKTTSPPHMEFLDRKQDGLLRVSIVA